MCTVCTCVTVSVCAASAVPDLGFCQSRDTSMTTDMSIIRAHTGIWGRISRKRLDIKLRFYRSYRSPIAYDESNSHVTDDIDIT